jgi:hypothetical protein
MSQATQTSPRLAGLLEQRAALESRLRGLVSGTGGAPNAREAARFQVPTFAERQAQQREWESRRDALNTRAAELRQQTRQSTPAVGRGASQTGSQRQSAEGGVSQWLRQRDEQRRSLRDAARDRLSPLNDVARTGRRLSDSLSRTTSQLRDLDRQMGEQGATQDRDALRDLGSGSLSRVSSQVDRATRIAEAPMRAVRKIDRFWEQRQREISGAMDETGPYVNRSRDRLSTDTGGSGDIFERMQRNRQRALQRREEQRRQDERDEARRQRARRNRREGN